MNKRFFKLRLSFQAKVLVPVVAILVLLTAATIWVVNYQIQRAAPFSGGAAT